MTSDHYHRSLTPAHIDLPDDAPQATMDACKSQLARHRASGAVLLAPGVCQPTHTPSAARAGCLMYDAGATYVLYPTGYTRTTDITTALFCAIRQYHGLSQSELGALLDVSEDAVANKERGRSSISTRDIAALAVILRHHPKGA